MLQSTSDGTFRGLGFSFVLLFVVYFLFTFALLAFFIVRACSWGRAWFSILERSRKEASCTASRKKKGNAYLFFFFWDAKRFTVIFRL